jgi:hypothetical protein
VLFRRVESGGSLPIIRAAGQHANGLSGLRCGGLNFGQPVLRIRGIHELRHGRGRRDHLVQNSRQLLVAKKAAIPEQQKFSALLKCFTTA